MQDLLHELSGQGCLDSSGDFTLDPLKALETDLSQFSLRDTPAYQELLNTLEQTISTLARD